MIRVGRNLLDIRRAAAKKLDISLWTDEKKKKPFKGNRVRDQKPQRYSVVDRASKSEDWHPSKWKGNVNFYNKDHHIAIPPKIELCLATLLDSRHYKEDQNEQFRKAAITFKQFYVKRVPSFVSQTFQMAEKKMRKRFSDTTLWGKNKKIYNQAIGQPDVNRGRVNSVQSDEIRDDYLKEEKAVLRRIINSDIDFEEIDYDSVVSKIWCKTFLPWSYAATYKVLMELKTHGFEPETMLDFGCGPGAGLWVANDIWKDTLRMYDGVDQSFEMCRTANYVVTGGDEDCMTDGIRFRRRVPEGTSFSREQYNIVFAANVLGDFRGRRDRNLLIDKLWGKVHAQGGVLVLIEYGNLAGHELIQESRAHLVDNHSSAYVVAPCGHNSRCGLFRPRRSKKPTDPEELKEWQWRPVCKYPLNYEIPPWGYHHKKSPMSHARIIDSGEFTYCVIGKNVSQLPEPLRFPRVIGSMTNRSGKNSCVVCVNGKPCALTATIGRDEHATNLSIRRARVGDTLPLVEREEWTPSEEDFAYRDKANEKKWEKRQARKSEKIMQSSLDINNLDSPFLDEKFSGYESIFLERDESAK